MKYENIAGEIRILDYIGYYEDIIIPNEIDGLSVTTIWDNSFREKNLASVIIPNSITDIGNNAFLGNSLTSVTIPDSINFIRGGSFKSNNLTSITIPDSIKIIFAEAFKDNSLKSVTIPDSVTDIHSGVFRSNSLTSVTIPDSVIFIGEGAFDDNTTIIQSKSDEVDEQNKVDIVAPKITLIGAKKINLEFGAEYTDAGVEVTDNIDEILEVSSIITDSEGRQIDRIDTTISGTYIITYTSIDRAGNKAVAKRTLVVSEKNDSKEKLVNYLNNNYSELETPLGTWYFEFEISENNININPHDYWIQTDWFGVSPYDLKYSIKFSEEEKKNTIKLLAEFQKNVANLAFETLPNKKIKGGFYSSFYRYPSLKIGYDTTRFFTWANYKPYYGDYDEVELDKFIWYDKINDYHFIPDNNELFDYSDIFN